MMCAASHPMALLSLQAATVAALLRVCYLLALLSSHARYFLQEGAVRRIMRIYNTSFQIGLVCMNPEGVVGAAAQGWTFTYAMASAATGNQSVAIQVAPLPPLAA